MSQAVNIQKLNKMTMLLRMKLIDIFHEHMSSLNCNITTNTSTANDVPTDIAARPDQTPVQLKLKFPATLKGNKHRSFHSQWYKSYLSIQGKKMLHSYTCCLFTTEPGKHWETFTKSGFRDWKHVMGRDGSQQEICKIFRCNH